MFCLQTWPLASLSLPAALEPSRPLISAHLSNYLVSSTRRGVGFKIPLITFCSTSFLPSIHSCLLCFSFPGFLGRLLFLPHPGWPTCLFCEVSAITVHANPISALDTFCYLSLLLCHKPYNLDTFRVCIIGLPRQVQFFTWSPLFAFFAWLVFCVKINHNLLKLIYTCLWFQSSVYFNRD